LNRIFSPEQRKDVAQRFADSRVRLVGLGAIASTTRRSVRLKKQIESTKEFIRLCHDVRGSGVKVKPNKRPPRCPPIKTLEQIGRSLNEVAAYGEGYGIQIRLEIHGPGTCEIPQTSRRSWTWPRIPMQSFAGTANPEDMKDPAGGQL